MRSQAGYSRQTYNYLNGLPIDGVFDYIAATPQSLVAMSSLLDEPLVVPPFHQTSAFLDAPDHEGIISRLAPWRFNILTQGKFSSNMNADVLFEAFAQVATKDRNFALHVVGAHDAEARPYIDDLIKIIHKYQINDQVIMYGEVSRSALATLYRRCDLFCTASTHPGFFSPLITALAFSTPILAVATKYIESVCGDAADYAKNANMLGRRLAQVSAARQELDRLSKKSRTRYETHFKTSDIERVFEAALADLTAHAARRTPAEALDASGGLAFQRLKAWCAPL